MRIIVTGSAGYIGTLLIKRLLQEVSIKKIVGVDLSPQPNYDTGGKVFWIQHDLSKDGWQHDVLTHGPFDAVVHLAFKIRSPYGKVEQTGKENLLASKNVFEFVFKNNIPRLTYSSSVASYGSRKENIGVLLREGNPLRESKSPYGVQKKEVEELLERFVSEKNPSTRTIVLRLGSVTGPFGQSLKSKFISLVMFLKKLLPFVIEANPSWARQFIHENDITELIWKTIVADKNAGALEIYNAAPPSFLSAKDMAKLLHKFVLKIPPSLVRPAFWMAWHFTRGIIPTHPDSSAGLIYPINVDGSKTENLGFSYKFSAADALLAKENPPDKKVGL